MASESRRDLILAAMIRVVGSKGYKETSVADVIEEAGTSRTTFYKHFEDKHECFLAAYDMLVEQVFAEVVAELRRRPVLAGAGRERPGDDRQTLRPRPRAGPHRRGRGRRRRRRRAPAALGRGRPLHRSTSRAVASSPSGRELPENISLMSAGAVSGLIFDELLAGRAAQLPAMLPDLLFAMLVPYIGPRAAAEEMRRVAAAS